MKMGVRVELVLMVVVLLGAAAWLPLVSAQVRSEDGCSFSVSGEEVSTCELGLNVTRFGKASWRTGTGGTSIYLGGPKTDAEKSNRGGYGVAIETDMQDPVQPKAAWLYTKPVDPTPPKGRCLTFWYAVGEELGVRSLEVLLLTFTSEVEDVQTALENDSVPIEYHTRTLWQHLATTKGEWQKVQLTFSTLDSHSLVFSASSNTRFTSHRGYVAVDSIAFSDGPCEDDCMFDVDLCEWSNTEKGDEFNWSIGRSSNKRGTGPARDQAAFLHPSIITGGYAYIDSGPPRLPEERARLVSRRLEATLEPRCLRFWVNMNGGGLGHLRVLHQVSGDNATTILWQLWENTNSGTDTWHPCQQTVASRDSFQLLFEGTVKKPGAGDIAIDTISFRDGACPNLPTGLKSSQFDCTFLVDTCKWRVTPPNGSSLSRVASNTYNPPGHTQSVYKITDMYMRFDLRCFKCSHRSSEALMSPLATFSTDHCLSFWVLMYTTIATLTYIGALEVVLMYPDKNETVWHLQNQQHAEWTYAQVPLPASEAPVRVAIQGVQGPHLMGMIGLDDITVFPLSCSLQPAIAKVEAGDCTYSQDLCSWKKEGVSSGSRLAQWHVADKNALKDHTFDADNGGYVYMETFNTPSTSNLTSPTLPSNQTFCFTFWFSPVYKDANAKLTIYRVQEGNTQRETVMWTLSQDDEQDNSNPAWLYGQLALDAFNSDGYKVVVVGKVTRGGWALDDFFFITDKEQCPVRPAKAKP